MSPVPVFFSIDEFAAFVSSRRKGPLFFITDTNTSGHCLPLFLKVTGWTGVEICLPAGEAHKHFGTCERVFEDLVHYQADRSALVINLGGGVVLDVGGFCASVFKRGLEFYHVPTSLLAMVDAAHGGKTGVDFRNLKNLIGTFSMPGATLVSPTFLQTLPDIECESGLAEMIKHELIGLSLPRFSMWPRFKGLSDSEKLEWIARSVQIKRRFAEEDPREKGIRKVLNFGHSFGHALESCYLDDNQPVTHGHAVAAGMEIELRLSNWMAGLSYDKMALALDGIRTAIRPLPKPLPPFERLLDKLLHDKKNNQGRVILSLIRDFGVPVYDQACSVEFMERAYSHFCHGH